MSKHRYAVLFALLALCSLPVAAQEHFRVSGSVQSDVLVPQEDTGIGTGTYSDDFLTNTYAEVHLNSEHFGAGARLEYLDHPLPGFEKDFEGWGVPYFYLRGRTGWLDVTLGDYYEQFGSGLILRTYEERSLGIDNSLRGARVILKPLRGVQIKALAGEHRHYWHARSLAQKRWTYGADVELSLENWFKRLDESGTRLTLGFSGVSKHEAGEEIPVQRQFEDSETGEKIFMNYRLAVPRDVAAYDVRLGLQKGNYSFLAEYAWKGQDPNSANSYVYHRGQTLLLSASYSKKGFSVLAQAKRSEDMSLRAKRAHDKASTALYLNHLPAFSYQHTYALASLYPYATQNEPGEWAFQAEVGYTFKRHTALGGKYGTGLKVNFSHIRGIDHQPLEDGTLDAAGSNGWKSKFFKMGPDTYYQDISVQVEKKVSKPLKLNFMYSAQRYNKTVVEGEGGTVKSHIFVAEGKYQFTKKLTLRGEAQYLHTRQDQKDWWFGLLELSVLPHLMFTVSDQFNAHVPQFDKNGASVHGGPTHREHYLSGSVTYTHRSHRLQVGYGKTRAGYNCSGGVCRYVPAQKGVQASYTFNF